jgi:UPF0042 nucleotide-binding protein
MKLVVVTGVSGAGKTTALHALEDLDFYCADNLPMPLLPRFIELLAGRDEVQRAALVVDARSEEFLGDASAILADLRRAGHEIEILFLDAPDDVLVRRFSETRRRHPLSETNVRAGLLAEREILRTLRQEATSVVDTGTLTVHTLRTLVLEHYGRHDDRLALGFLSFGFKYGLPAEADVVLDVRFLPNPFFVEGLSPLSGKDGAVARFVLDTPDAQTFLSKAEDMLDFLVRGFEKEGKSYATIAIGCTGGRHRSVALVEELAERFARRSREGTFARLGQVGVRHRDLAKS